MQFILTVPFRTIVVPCGIDKDIPQPWLGDVSHRPYLSFKYRIACT